MLAVSPCSMPALLPRPNLTGLIMTVERLNAAGQPVKPPLTQISRRQAPWRTTRLAREHMEAHAWAHIESGADQGLTLAHNRQAFDRRFARSRWPICPAPIRGKACWARVRLAVAAGTCCLSTAGASRRRARHGSAAMAMRTGMVVSTLSSCTLEAIGPGRASRSPGAGRSGPLWFQLYRSASARAHAAADPPRRRCRLSGAGLDGGRPYQTLQLPAAARRGGRQSAWRPSSARRATR
jgi:hypothetical protein